MEHWKPPITKNRPIAIVGIGEVGRRIALSWVSGGFDVNLFDSSPYNRNASLAFIHHNIDVVPKSTIKSSGHVKIFEYIQAAVQPAWLVITVADELDSRHDIFAHVEQFSADDAILATTSSVRGLREMVDSLSERTRQRSLHLRYALNPNSRLVELMTNGFTTLDVISFVSDRLKECGLCPVSVHKESPGFVMGRIWAAVQREALAVLAEGVTTPNQIDKAWNLWVEGSQEGPCMSMDSMGLDTVATYEQFLNTNKGTSDEPLKILQKNYLAHGKLGAKSRQGGLYPHTPINLKKLSSSSQTSLTPLLFVLNLGTAVEHPSLHTGKVYLASPDGRDLKTLISDQPRPDGIDVSLTTGMMYWTLMGTLGKNDGLVRSCSIAGGEPVDLVSKGTINTPKQTVVDHVNSKLYFYDREGMKVWRCNFDGTNLEIIIQTGDLNDASHTADATRWCVGICVSPSNGKFYWTQKGPSKGNKGRIFCANMTMPKGDTAANRSDIVCLFENLPEPIDLELDEENQELWWTDRGDYPNGNSLNKADLKQSKLERVLVARHFHEAIGLKIDWVNLHVYLTDIGGEIYVMDIDGKNKRKIYDVEDAAFSGICLIHV